MLNSEFGQGIAHVASKPESRAVVGIELSALAAGREILVETRHSRYRFVMLDRTGWNVLAEGGRYFSQQTVARIEGARHGDRLLHPGWIALGLSLELSVRGERIVTSRVQSISVDTSAAA